MNIKGDNESSLLMREMVFSRCLESLLFPDQGLFTYQFYKQIKFCFPYILSPGDQIIKISIPHNKGGIMGVDTKNCKIEPEELMMNGL